MLLIAGAYPAAPPSDPWDRETEGQFWSAFLAGAPDAPNGPDALDGLDGLELPWLDGALHAHDESWLLGLLPQDWTHVVTTIPDTMVTGRVDPAYGLASVDPDGRARAVDRMRSLRDHLAELSAARGRPFAAAVEVHSAPRRASIDAASVGSVDAFASSLAELAGWDWSGAQLVVEHCDAVVPGRESAKGFLSLDDELAAVAGLPALATAVTMGVNWGRSVIEGHDRQAAVRQVAQASDAGALSTLLFSGVADTGPDAAWIDNHLAPDEVNPASLLRRRDIADCVSAAGGAERLQVCGVKVGATPGHATPAERADDVLRSLASVRSVLGAR